jgi:galactose mutarotase-like enzyme
MLLQIEITNNGSTAKLNTMGAELVSLKNSSNIEHLWQGDKTYWAGQSPVLFPCVGKSRDDIAIIYGEKYDMPRHGFPRKMEFELISHNTDSAVFSLKANEDTRKMYPLNFDLQIKYIIKNATIEVCYIVNNLDERDMYFSIGAHPGFNCPLIEGESFEDYFLEFEKEETADIAEIIPNGLRTGNRIPYLKNQHILPLKHSLFDKDVLIFDDLKSRSVSLKSRISDKGVKLEFPDFPHLGLWSNFGETPFVCIEPWIGLPSTVDSDFTLESKTGIIKLKKGETFNKSYFITML